jgi:hypothetical protein
MHFPYRVCIVLLLAALQQASADQLILDNGDRISGKLISFSKELVRIETPYSGVIQVERKHVDQLSTDNEVVVDLISGERVVGKIAPGEGGEILIRSSILGESRLTLDAVDTIRSGAPIQMADVRGRGTPQAPDPVGAQTIQSIGQRPEADEDIRKVFLRQSTVLLAPGQIEIEAAISYARIQSVSSILNAKIRQFQLPVAARIGLFNRGEGFLTIPAGYVRREMAFADTAISYKKSGFGDLNAGLNYELAAESASRPDIIASLGFGAGTGSKPTEEGLSVGSAHRAITFGMQFIKSTDPVALFWGINYAHQFEARYFLNDAVHNVRPGETAGYNFGFGFAVNENISLSAQLQGSYQWATRADGTKLSGSSSEPVSLRTALTFRHSRNTYIEPSLILGLDGDTPDFVLGFSMTHRFGKKGLE